MIWQTSEGIVAIFIRMAWDGKRVIRVGKKGVN